MNPFSVVEAPLRDAPRPTTASVRVIGLGTSVPPLSSSQEETLDFILKTFRVKATTRALYTRAFAHKSIARRAFALSALKEVLETDHDRINARFEKWAVDLSARALDDALRGAGVAASSVDYVAVATCTGYLCPGLSAYMVDACGLRRDVRLADIVGMGCGAAIPAIEQAHNFVVANPGATAAVVCTEICSAAMFSNDTAEIVISNTIFADGSAALLLRSGRAASDGGEEGASAPADGSIAPIVRGFSSVIVPEWRESLRFRLDHGYLKNKLSKDVPERAAVATKKIVADLLDREGVRPAEVTHWLVHAGGEKVLSAIERKLDLPADALASSRRVLENFGNMSSPTVLFVLNEQLASRAPRRGELGILCSFGAGFSAHAALLEF